MKKLIFPFLSIISLLLGSCERNLPSVLEEDFVYRRDMRTLVINITQKARASDGDFLIIPQNGQDVVLRSYCSDCSAEVDQTYMNSVSAVGREDLHYGYTNDNVQNTSSQTQEARAFLNLYEKGGKPVFVTDYCSVPALVDDSYTKNKSAGYIGFAAPSRELDAIPSYPAQPFQVNNEDVKFIGDARNFLYLLNPSGFSGKQDYLQSLASTSYDLLIIDAFYEGELLSRSEVASLKNKPNGGKRLVVAYLSIGEAESYRYYWQPTWKVGTPEWIEVENPEWPGNYKVQYWNTEWHNLIYADQDSYLSKLLSSGFDGAYLDMIDAFEYFEE